MSIRKKEKLDLELMSYTDIAYEILKEDKKQYNTPNLFREVCNLLELSEEEFEAKIGDFFTALSTDKRFILIDSVNWDLKENHIVKVVVDDDSESDEETDESEEENEEGTFIRRERHSGELTRSFAVSKDVSKEDIRAKLEDGTLTLLIPKEPSKDASSNIIEIE